MLTFKKKKKKLSFVLMTPNAKFPLILDNYKNKLVIFLHSLEEGDCCTCSTVNPEDSDRFNTKAL